MFLVTVACVLAACLIPHASVAQEQRPSSAPAATTVPAEDLCQLHPYNIKNLTRKAYWFTNVTVPQLCSDPNATSCTLYFSFCKALKLPFDAKDCDGAAVCLVSKDPKGKELHSFSLGQFSLNETQFYEANDTESGAFYMEVNSGSTVPQCNNTAFKTRIDLVCDPSVQWRTHDLTNNNISNVELDDMCSYKITLHYAGACLPHNPSSTIPTPTSTSVVPTNSSSTSVNPTSSSSMTTTVGPANSSSATVSPTPSSSSSSMTTSPSSSGSASVIPPSKTITASASTQSQSGSSVPTITPTSSPLPPPPHSTTEKPIPPKTPSTQPHPHPTKPTANPLASKVSGLTAGIVIFALLFFACLLVAIGLVWYFKFHKNRYHKLPNEDL